MTHPWRVFLVVSILFGLAYFIVQPSDLVQPDENPHWLHIYNLSQGELFCEWTQYPDECQYPRAVFDRWQEISLSPYEGMTRPWDQVDYTDTVNVSSAHTGPVGRSPLMYAPQVVGVWIGRIFGSTGSMILGGRLMNFIVYVAGMSLLISRLKYGQWAFAAIGLIPTVMVLSASLSPDMMTNLVVFAAVGWVINRFASDKPMGWPDRIVFAVLCLATALTKANSALVFLPLVFMPAAKWSAIVGPAWKKQLVKWGTGAAGAVLLVGAYMAWSRFSAGPFPPASHWPAPLVDDGSVFSRAVNWAKILWMTYFGPSVTNAGYSNVVWVGAMGTFASFRYSLPMIMIAVELIVILFALMWPMDGADNLEADSGVQRAPAGLWAGALVAGVINLVAIVYVLYTTWAVIPSRLGPTALYADGVQGRYLTAFLVLLVPVFYRVRSKFRLTTSAEVVGSLVGLVSLGVLMYTVVQTYAYWH